jgi:hypothetical protein
MKVLVKLTKEDNAKLGNPQNHRVQIYLPDSDNLFKQLSEQFPGNLFNEGKYCARFEEDQIIVEGKNG